MTVSNLSNDTIIWYAKSSTPNAYGEYTYTSSTIKGRVSTRIKEVQNSQGQVVTSYAYVITPYAIGFEDKMTLEDGKQRNVLSVNQINDKLGNFHHSEVYL